MRRTHTCGECTTQHQWQTVTLCGWVNKTRDLGGMTFIDLRDRYGITQITVDPQQVGEDMLAVVHSIGREYVISVTGKIIPRPDSMINTDMATGTIEVQPETIKVLSECGELPFSIDHENEVGEEIRLSHRYLDLRRTRMRDTLKLRHRVMTQTMAFFDDNEFLYIDTPTLVKNTPEGSREFVVPSRIQPGNFYVLPQAPQQLKQLSMVAGVDRYFQLARCYRDEDPRGDRQPEFTQVDLEMSFVHQEDVLQILEQYFNHITATCADGNNNRPKKSNTYSPFLRLTWEDCMNKYGSDKPDLRSQDLAFVDVTTRGNATEFGVFKNAKTIKALVASKQYSRSEIDRTLTPLLQQHGAKGLAYLILSPEEGIKWPIAKFFSPEELNNLVSITGAQTGETIFFQADEWLECVELMGVLRKYLLDDLGLLKDAQDQFGYTFVVDFPMFELNDDGSLNSVHHPFTKPKDEAIPFIKELARTIKAGGAMTQEDKLRLLEIKADCYDVIMNGYELGSGSIRITDPELQEAIFIILGLSLDDIQARFGHLLKAFGFGVPPHGGFAVGFDRVVMLLLDQPNIREVIPYPKNQKYVDLMMGSPSTVEESMLDELGLQLKPQVKSDA